MNGAILLVDDRLEDLRFLLIHLQHIGLKVFVAKSGEEALQRLTYILPDIILLDVLMPGLDGFETCRRLKNNPKMADIPVIFMTSLSDTEYKIQGFEAGGVDYVVKPLRVEEVVARIKIHLTLQQLQRQLQEQNALLAEQNLRFQRLAEVSFEGLVIHREQKIIDVNQALLKIFGYAPSELLGEDVLKLVTPASRQIVQAALNDERESLYKAEGLRQDGASFPLEMQSGVMLYQGDVMHVTAVRDKTLEQQKAQLERENTQLKVDIRQNRYKFGDIVGKSPVMQHIYEYIQHAAETDAHVAIYGESGTGKELIARMIHERSARSTHEFVIVNCGAIPATLFESEFFGYRKGAFTGALRDKPGFFDLAHGGTLFLDEVAELTPVDQVKLLRAIETGEYIPLGTNKRKQVDVRIIAATNRNIETLRRQGKFRDDFFYRIHVIVISVPPLRQRKEDIPLLVDHLLAQHSSAQKRRPLPGKVLDAFYAYDWPGNVRELQNMIQRYLAGQSLIFEDTTSPAEDFTKFAPPFHTHNLREIIAEFEKQCLLTALHEYQWHREQTARALGIPVRTLHRKMKQYGLTTRKISRDSLDL